MRLRESRPPEAYRPRAANHCNLHLRERPISAEPQSGSGQFAPAGGLSIPCLSSLALTRRTFICDVLAQGPRSPFSIASSQTVMSDLTRRKQELDEEVRRISHELKRLRKQGRRAGSLEVTAGQRSTARVLTAMRDGEPTAAMAFLKANHTGEPTAAAAWADVESDLQA